jgi:hypothetical protein
MKTENFQDWGRELATKLGTNDFNSPRVRLYFFAVIESFVERCAKLEAELKFEKAVNERVLETVKGLLGDKLEDREGSKAAH